MTLLAPFYLAVGSVVVEPGDGSADYHIRSMSFPEPASDGAGGHFAATRTIPLSVDGTSASDLSANIAALRRECVRDGILYFKPTLAGDLLSCRIREGSLVEADYDPLRRSVSPWRADLVMTLVTDPYWCGPWCALVSPAAFNVPGHLDIASVTGEVDAELAMRCVAADNGTGLYIGVKPDPDTAGYDYYDDYGGEGDTADANAFGGYKVASASLTTTPAAIGTAPVIATNPNRGRHIMLARIDSDAAAAASLTYTGRVTTTGYAISESVSVDEQAVTATALSLVGVELGDIQIPAGQVPDLDTLGAWGAEAAQVTQAEDDGTKTLSDSSGELSIRQTFAGFGGRLTAVEYTVDTAASKSLVTTRIYIREGDEPLRSITCAASDFTVGTHKIALNTPLEIVAGTTYSFEILLLASPSFNIGLAYANGHYADGELTTPTGSGESAGDDLLFKVYGQTAVAFDTTNPVLAACSESSKIANLDFVQRIPIDYAALVYRRASAGVLAVYFDGKTPFIADTDGIGPAIYDKCELRGGGLKLKPGVTNRVVFGVAQADEVPNGVTVTYRWRPRFMTATG